jgi:hypothetical protein
MSYGASDKARALAETFAEVDRLSKEIQRLYDAMVPTFFLPRRRNSHLGWHRKRRIRKKWQRRLGGDWLRAGAQVLRGPISCPE